jgi:hypothetical protein
MSKNHSSDYFRAYLAVVTKLKGPRNEVSREGRSSFGTFEEEP